MKNQHITSFLSRYPGPYFICPGRDGVDSTFDIICQKTDQVVVASHYWVERESALRTANVTRIALELARRTIWYPILIWKSRDDLRSFATDFPGPYAVKEFAHNHRHSEVLVTGIDRESGIIGYDTLPDDPVAHHDCVYIANALNQLLRNLGETRR